MKRPSHRIGLDVLTFEVNRRRPGRRLVGGLAALLTSLALTACEPDEQMSARVADAEGTTVGQATATAPRDWTGTGAYLAGMTAFDQRDMKSAAELLSLALSEDPGNPVLAQKALVALMSAGRIEDAVTLAKQMEG